MLVFCHVLTRALALVDAPLAVPGTLSLVLGWLGRCDRQHNQLRWGFAAFFDCWSDLAHTGVLLRWARAALQMAGVL